jgi:putative chitinase
MQIDRKAFFDGYRSAFGKLKQSQVNGLGLLLSSIEDYDDLPDVRWVAYVLATVKHECAETWQPIVERGPRDYFAKYEPDTDLGKRLGNIEPGDGFLFRGRGYVQITGRANYARVSRLIDSAAGLEHQPDRALIPAVAYEIMAVGMRDGLFTGRKLRDYFNAHTDYIRARQIVNGLDQAQRIADYAAQFEQIIDRSRVKT